MKKVLCINTTGAYPGCRQDSKYYCYNGHIYTVEKILSYDTTQTYAIKGKVFIYYVENFIDVTDLSDNIVELLK